MISTAIRNNIGKNAFSSSQVPFFFIVKQDSLLNSGFTTTIEMTSAATLSPFIVINLSSAKLDHSSPSPTANLSFHHNRHTNHNKTLSELFICHAQVYISLFSLMKLVHCCIYIQ